MRAREALADCEHALADFEAGANTPFQRSRWVAALTLLRTVGLVLKAVDRPVANPPTRQRIDDAWKQLNASKPEPRIFHDFIDAERYQAVHLYEIRARVNVTITLPSPGSLGPSQSLGPSLPLGASQMLTDEDDRWGWNTTVYNFVMRTGPFAGRSPLDLCREAIVFWKEYLDAIDAP